MTQTADPIFELAGRDVPRAAVLDYFRAECEAGRTPTTAELAERFDRTTRWARKIAEDAYPEQHTGDRVPADVPEDHADSAEHPAEDLAATEVPDALPGPEAERFAPAPETARPAPEPTITEPANAPAAENLASFAQNPAQDATTPDPRPIDHTPTPVVTQPHTAAPSWTVQDPAAALTPESVPVGSGTVTVPATDPIVPATGPVADLVAPVVPAEHDPELVAPAGTVERSADRATETPVEQAEDRKVPGRFVAWLAFATGIGASVAANMLHAAEGGAHVAELIGAAFWPLALLLSIELLTRVTWPRGWLWGTGRFVGVGLVAVVAFVLSYRHMAGLLTSWGEDTVNAHLGPLAVDGLMLVAATALLAITRTRKNRP
ncbi:DUF2637 domain-containing protein [Kribbella sp. NPDC059898]|uniref:DUF2637 domain-containing protein n=1 Tax=Kribbella sp. NPDC059898 TaxID=3346995 RepID=UPI0036631DD6